MTTTAITCESCSFGAGYRTGTINLYRLVTTVGDRGIGDAIELCDDCLAHTPAGIVEPIEPDDGTQVAVDWLMRVREMKQQGLTTNDALRIANAEYDEYTK